VRLEDVCGYALTNLRRRPMRTALTVSGVAVGVGTLVLLVSLAAGLQQIVSSQFNQAELITRIVVERQGGGRGFRALLGGDDDEPEGPPLTDAAIAKLSNIPGVVTAYPDVGSVLLLEANEQIAPAAASSLPVEALEPTYPPAILAGKYWEVSDAGQVVVLPSSMLSRLGFAGPAEAIGQQVSVTHYTAQARYHRELIPAVAAVEGQPRPRPRYRYLRPDKLEVTDLDVIGVYDSSKFGFLGRVLHVPMEVGLLLKERYGFATGVPKGEHLRAIVRVKSHEQIAAVRDAIKAQRYKTETVFDYLQAIDLVFAVFKVMLTFFGGVGLVVAFFGIANTMLMAVLERTREIGVLKAIGARDRDIRRVFFMEATAIGVLGGIVGLVGAWSLGGVFNSAASWIPGLSGNTLQTGFFVVEGWLAAAAVALAMVVAGVAGLYPAWRAARMVPVEALRRE
jgi:putative ABC transport system permease protein